jgi:hypothetical protein
MIYNCINDNINRAVTLYNQLLKEVINLNDQTKEIKKYYINRLYTYFLHILDGIVKHDPAWTLNNRSMLLAEVETIEQLYLNVEIKTPTSLLEIKAWTIQLH